MPSSGIQFALDRAVRKRHPHTLELGIVQRELDFDDIDARREVDFLRRMAT